MIERAGTGAQNVREWLACLATAGAVKATLPQAMWAWMEDSAMVTTFVPDLNAVQLQECSRVRMALGSIYRAFDLPGTYLSQPES